MRAAADAAVAGRRRAGGVMRTTPPSQTTASVSVFVAASVWGLYWVPLHYVEALGVGGGWAVAIINVPALLVLVPLALWAGGLSGRTVQLSAMIGFFTGAALALYASGLVHSSVVRATLLFYLTPVWATLIGIFWLGEKANWSRWAAILAGFLGLLLLVSGGEDSIPLNIGDVFALASGILWAVGAAMIMRHGDLPVPGMMVGMFFFTGLVAIGVGYSVGGDVVPDLSALTEALPAGSAVAILVFVPTVWTIFWAQKYLFPGRAGLLMMSEVMMAVISASIFIPEQRMSVIEWSGAALIIIACLVEVMSSPSAPEARA